MYGFSPADGGVGRWSNMNLPHIDVSVSLTEKLKMDFLLGYMFAPENNGVGGGHNRGLLFTWKNTFTLAEGLISEKDKLTGHLLVEMIDPGDYYNGTQQDELAGFLRSEISYSF